ncbi:MAG: hypothetical protein ACOCUF_04145 [Patescibacteria group bacterium]
MIVKFIYTIFLGILVALFVGLGIDTFYQAPERPEYPVELRSMTPEKEKSAEFNQLREQYEKEQQKHQEQRADYNRNVSIIAIASSILLLVVSLTFLGQIKIIADGVLLGGVFTAVYSIIRGLMTDLTQFRFLIVAAGLVIALVLGYIKFVKPDKK